MGRPKHKIAALLDADWVEVEIPKRWKPNVIGEELIGYYGGRTMSNGMYGQYELILVHVPKVGAYLISGTDIIQRADAAQLSEGDPIRVVWLGYKNLGEERRKKLFELWITRP